MTPRDLKKGRPYVVLEQFRDEHGFVFEPGQVLTFEEGHFLPYDDGHTLVFAEARMYVREGTPLFDDFGRKLGRSRKWGL